MREAQSSKRKAKNQNSKLKTLRFNFTLFALSFSLLIFSFPTHAVEIDPMRLEYSLEHGRTYSGSFQLKNSSTFSADIFVSTGEYRYVFSGGTIPPQDPKLSRLASCQDWFQFEKTKFSLNPGESADVKFLIKVPKDAASEHLSAVIFDEKRHSQEAQHEEKTGNVRIEFTPRFSIPVYISIKGTEKAGARITDLTVTSEYQKGGAIADITLENTGNVHIRPVGALVILNQGGELVKNLPMGKSFPIFPGYKEAIPIICPKLPPGKYTAVATIEIAKDNIIQKKTAFTYTKSGEIE